MADLDWNEDPRVRMAAERTMLAWVRTGLAMMGFGFVVARFGLFLREFAAITHEPEAPTGGLSLWIGTALVLLGVLVSIAAAVEHFLFLRRLRQKTPPRVAQLSLAMIVGLAVALFGMLMAVYLVSVS